MFVWWFIGSIGYVSLAFVYADENRTPLHSLDEAHPGEEQSEVLNVDTPLDKGLNNTDEGTGTTGTPPITPPSLTCYQCTNCKSKSDLVSYPCESGISMCYKAQKVLNNTDKTIHRGCSTSKSQCEVPHDDGSHTLESVTCCNFHQCNQAIQFKPGFFSSILSLFMIISQM